MTVTFWFLVSVGDGLGISVAVDVSMDVTDVVVVCSVAWDDEGVKSTTGSGTLHAAIVNASVSIHAVRNQYVVVCPDA